MFIVFLRVSIIYITVLIFLRLMGKRQIGEMQPYEVVITLIIADLATLPMSETNIPLLNGILPLAILVLVHYAITIIVRKSVKMRQLMSGKPVVIITPNGIDYDALKNLNMNIDDILEMIRQQGYYSFDQVLYAIIETNGKISIVPTNNNSPVTCEDLNIQKPMVKLPHILVSNGKIVEEHFKKFNFTIEKFNKILKHLDIKSTKDLIIFSIDENGKVYYQTNKNTFKIINNLYEEIELWKHGFIC